MNYGQFTYGNAISYLLGCIGKISVLLRGFANFPSCFTGASRRLSENGNRIDMTNANLNELYDVLGAFFYVNLLGSAISLVLEFVQGNVLGGAFGVVGLLVFNAIGMLLYSLFIYLMETKKNSWSLGVIHVLIVLGYISFGLNCFMLVINTIGLIGSILKLSVVSIIDALINLVQTLAGLLCVCMTLVVFSRGTVSMQQTQNQYGSYGQQDPQNYWQNDPRGVSGLGAVNSSAGVAVSAPSDNPVSNPSEVLTEQMYSCPYCSKPIHYKESPCHHCGQQVQW